MDSYRVEKKAVMKIALEDEDAQIQPAPVEGGARKPEPHTARMAHDKALAKVMQLLLRDDTQVYKQFVENDSFRREVSDLVYALTNQ